MFVGSRSLKQNVAMIGNGFNLSSKIPRATETGNTL